MVFRRTVFSGSILALSVIAVRPVLGTILTFNNSRSDGQSYVGNYSDPTDPLSTYGSNVNFGAATSGTTTVVQNTSNTDTFNYLEGNGWTPNVSMGYSVGPYPANVINYTGPASQWPNGAAELQSYVSNPNDDFYFSFTPSPGYAVRLNQFDFVNASYGAMSFAITVYENSIGGTQMVPTYVPPNLGSGPGMSVTNNLQNHGSTFYPGTVILNVYVINGNSGSLGLTNLSFDQESIANFGNWGIAGSGDWNIAGNWVGDAVPNAVGASATLGSAISSAQTVYSNSAITVGSLTFNNANEYVLTGAGSLTLQSSSGNAAVNVDQGTQEINLPTTLASDTVLEVAAASTLIFGNPLTVDSGVALTEAGTGTVTYESIINVDGNGSIAFGNSTHAHQLSLASGSSASVVGTGTVLELDSLSNLGTVDVKNNEVLINYGSGPDPIASIRAELVSGYAGGAWNGAGIDSSIAAANAGSYGLGYADAADAGNPAGLAPGTIKIVYTLLGDANLDGAVNSIDFAILASNFNKAVSGWDQGDFNYDGSVNSIDFAALASNFNKGSSIAVSADVEALDAFAAANGLLADVPEPASMGLLALGAIGMLGRRRRCRRARSFAQN